MVHVASGTKLLYSSIITQTTYTTLKLRNQNLGPSIETVCFIMQRYVYAYTVLGDNVFELLGKNRSTAENVRFEIC